MKIIIRETGTTHNAKIVGSDLILAPCRGDDADGASVNVSSLCKGEIVVVNLYNEDELCQIEDINACKMVLRLV